jgi:hypothetical protein
MKLRVDPAIAVAAAALLAAPQAGAQLTKADRAALEESIPPTVYLRIDLPCIYGKAGIIKSWVEPMVEVSRTGVTISQDEGWRGKLAIRRNQFYGFGPNDSLKYSKLEIGDGDLTVFFVGSGLKEFQKDQVAAIRMVQCKTLRDFKAAFDRAFSKVPLQDEHPDWSGEIRKAIGERVVSIGMSMDQVRCITGTPIDIEGRESGRGPQTETWHIRQERGLWRSNLKYRMQVTGLVRQVTFVDGKVTNVDSAKPEPNR